MVKITDNVLKDHDLDLILNRVTQSKFPWYWCSVLPDEWFSHDDVYNFQFGHILFSDGNVSSHDFNLFLPVLDVLNIKTLHRVKLNLNPITSSIIEHGYHVDNNIPNSTTSIFYLNTNDGYTKFESTQQKVLSVSNRLISFDTSLKHTGTTCTNSSRRMVLNINYEHYNN